MRRVLILGLALSVVGCSRFDARVEGVTVAECYSAFASLSISSPDPDLGFSAAQKAEQMDAARAGLMRLKPYIGPSMTAVGGSSAFMDIAAAWRIQPNLDVARAATPPAKKAAYQRLLTKTGECHAAMTAWGAPKAAAVTGR